MEKTLYERLGGAKGIAALVDDIVEAHMANSVIGARFLPYRSQPERLATVKQHLRTFLGAGTGGPETYEGRDMRTAHRGMNVNPEEYMATVDDILATLEKHRIDEATRKDVLAIAWSLKGDIMRV
jgi:hemoglobin